MDEELLAYLFDDVFAQHVLPYDWEGSEEEMREHFAKWRKGHNFKSTRHIYEVQPDPITSRSF